MLNSKFDAWCDAATAKIRYGGDRDAVSAELRAHLEDRYDALVEAGYSQAEATAKALEAMGDAKAIAPQLGKIHRPWLGWVYSALRIAGISVLVCVLIRCWFVVAYEGHRFVGRDTSAVALHNQVYSVDDITYYDTPNVRTWVDGYCLRVMEVAVIPEDSMFHASQLHVNVEVTWWPGMDGFGAMDEIWALDSHGTYYPSYDINGVRGTPRIAFTGGYFGLEGKSICYFAIANFDCESEWVELHYDREGRDMVLRIDLTGGGQE